MELWTALTLGFLGSFHCVGMCGPIALSIPRHQAGISGLTLNAAVYNSGRILIYTIFGLIFGLLGTQVTLSGFQGWLSITLGAFVVIAVFFSREVQRLMRMRKNKPLMAVINKAYGSLIKKQSYSALFGLGVLNGLLPCAFVYTGLATAVLTENPMHSMAYMALFGLGTVPAMFSMYLAPTFISLDLRSVLRKTLPYFALFLGVFLIIRGVILQDLYLPSILIETLDPFCIFPGSEN